MKFPKTGPWIHMIWPLALILALLLGRSMFSGTTVRAGKRLYEANCSGCHGLEGQGFRELIPPLAGSDYWAANREELPCIISLGLQGEVVVNGKSYNQPMAGITGMSISQVQSIINYVEVTWGDPDKKVNYQEVKDLLERCGK